MSTTAKLLTNASTISTGLDMYREGTAQAQAGIATMVAGISDNQHYSMRWSYGVGDNEVSGVFKLGDMFKGLHHEDGKVDGKFLPAAYRALADNFLRRRSHRLLWPRRVSVATLHLCKCKDFKIRLPAAIPQMKAPFAQASATSLMVFPLIPTQVHLPPAARTPTP